MQQGRCGRSGLIVASAYWLLAAALTVAAYFPGLSGDFLFDDNPHIVRNETVQIESVSPADLWQAWNSSPVSFPNSRPLAMLTFGVNHAFSGLSPFAFKATNLAFHLLTGLVLFAVARRLGRQFLQLEERQASPGVVCGWAWLTATLWLLHPLNLSPVLLSVQRMTILSTLIALLGFLVYLIGRERLSRGDGTGLRWIWASPVFAALGLLAKENALLLPLLLFVSEWSLLRFRGLDARSHRNLQLFFVATVAVPALVVATYLAWNPGYLSSAGRPFTIPERLLTESRVLWFYLRLLLSPDISAMGLFHDDFLLSRGVLQPWTTLAAIAAWLAALVGTVALRQRAPLLSFAILFFLAGHALESTVIPLELVYEHRNYLPGIAPLFALAYLPTAGAGALPVSRPLVYALTGVVLTALAAGTALRASDWSGFGRLIAAEVEHHPNSRRVNFQYAQALMAQLDNPTLRDEAARLAREHFELVATLDPDNADALFGLIVLDLHLDRVPPSELVDQLADRLRQIPFSPLNVNSGQFAYLVKWHDTSEVRARLPKEHVLSIFEAALENPTNPPIGRAAIYHAMRAYHHRVLGDAQTALHYAELAVQTAPAEWDMHDRRIRLLAAVGRFDDADRALQEASDRDYFSIHGERVRHLAALINRARRGEPIPTSPVDEPDASNERRH